MYRDRDSYRDQFTIIDRDREVTMCKDHFNIMD